MSGLDALAPQDRQITVAGREIALSPVRMGKLAPFAAAAMPVAGLILDGRILEAATEHYDSISTALIIAAGVEQAWLDDLAPDDFLRLTQAVVEVNGDFFIRRLTPVLLAMQAKLQMAMTGTMAPSLPSSGATDTASPPS